MDIYDGYTILRKLGGQQVEFRPMLLQERQLFLRRLKASEAPQVVCLNAIRRHVVWYDRHLPAVTDEIVSAISGRDRKAEEADDAANLYHSVKLAAKHPRLAAVSCRQCRKYEFFPMTGRFAGTPGKPTLRDKSDKVLCETPMGCPKGSPDEEQWNMMTAKNRLAVKFHDQCKAVCHWPDDPIVRHNAEIIERARRSA